MEGKSIVNSLLSFFVMMPLVYLKQLTCAKHFNTVLITDFILTMDSIIMCYAQGVEPKRL